MHFQTRLQQVLELNLHQQTQSIPYTNHGLSTNDSGYNKFNSVLMWMDHYGSDHPYPRPTDPIVQTAITAVTTNTGLLMLVSLNLTSCALTRRTLLIMAVHTHYYPEEVLN